MSAPQPGSAGHIDLPLDAPAAQPAPRTRSNVRAMPFIDQRTVELAMEARNRMERERTIIKAARAEGLQRGITVGYWRGARHFGWAAWVFGMACGAALVGLGWWVSR